MRLTWMVIAGTSVAVTAQAVDWPQYRGPKMDGTTAEKISTVWPTEGPKAIWSIPLGESFGSFAVSGGKAFIFVERDKQEVCAALDEKTGKEIWASLIDSKTVFENEGGNGPRSTPTVDGKFVYVFGTWLKLFCLRAADGGVVWQHDLAKEFEGQVGTSGISNWGSAASPVIDGNLVFVAGGGSGQALMAFDKKTGAVVWKGQKNLITHATPTLATIHGVRQIVFFTQQGLISLATATGEVLWKQAFMFSTSTAASPIVDGDIVYCSAGYGVGGGAYRIEKTDTGYKSVEIWRTQGKNMNHWSTPILYNGHLYGLFGFKEFGRMPLKCVDLKTGEEKWAQPGFGQGAIIMVGDKLLVQGDAGQLVLVEAKPDAYHEVARAQPLGGKCWTMAVVSGGKIFARSTKQGVCLDVTAK